MQLYGITRSSMEYRVTSMEYKETLITYNKRHAIQTSSYGTSKRFYEIPGSKLLEYKKVILEYQRAFVKVPCNTKKLLWNTKKVDGI